jgi:APA family basic amino acid/polyamine antiporter
MCAFMMLFLPFDTWLRLLVWTIIGTLIYFGYSVRHAMTPRWHIEEHSAK